MRAAQQHQHGLVQREADPKADERREDQCGEHLGNAVQMAVQQVVESPGNMAGTGGDHDHTGQSADQCMGRRRGDAMPPGDEVPRDGADQTAQHDGQGEHAVEIVQCDDFADGVGHCRAAQQRAEEFEESHQQNGLHRRHRARGDDRGDDVGGVMETVGVLENQHDDDGRNREDQESGVHVGAGTTCRALGF